MNLTGSAQDPNQGFFGHENEPSVSMMEVVFFLLDTRSGASENELWDYMGVVRGTTAPVALNNNKMIYLRGSKYRRITKGPLWHDSAYIISAKPRRNFWERFCCKPRGRQGATR
jgi:hypothetical protein